MSTSLSLEQFAALNDEIAALARAGVPLDRGLATLSPSLPTNMRRLTDELGKRMAAGESLLSVLRDERIGAPPAYVAIVEAGLRSGRLGAALEDVADTARRVRDLRRGLTLALLYPFLVAATAYGLLLLATLWVIPTILSSFESLAEVSVTRWDWLARICETTRYWAPWPPILGILALAWCWWRLATFHRRSLSRHVNRPSLFASPSRIVGLSHLATLLDLLDLLFAHQIPLADALELATQASDVKPWQVGGRKLAERLRAGEPLTVAAFESVGLPATLGWLVASNPQSSRLETRRPLRRAADECRRRATRELDRVTKNSPTIYACIVGIVVGLPIICVLFAPWIDLLYRLLETHTTH